MKWHVKPTESIRPTFMNKSYINTISNTAMDDEARIMAPLGSNHSGAPLEVAHLSTLNLKTCFAAGYFVG
jgi:hypothetical protein